MLRQLHALVVDDEPHCRDLLCRQIGRTCPSITVIQTASSAKEAERLIQELAPDVVFMDIHMPHKTGLDLLESLESRDFYLVFTTAFDRYAVEALRKQAFDYLLKPINRDDLQACARRILMHFYHHRVPGEGALSPAMKRLEILTSDGILSAIATLCMFKRRAVTPPWPVHHEQKLEAGGGNA